MMNKHSERATIALRKLAEFDPAFASLSLWCNHRDTRTADIEALPEEDRKIFADFAHAPAWTDGRTIYYSAEFAGWPLRVQMGVAAHEIMHVAFRHINRARKLRERFGAAFDPEVFNIATDAIINETLRMAGYALPEKGVFLVELLKKSFNEDIRAEDAIGEWDAEKLYIRLMKDTPQQAGGQGSGHGQGAGQGSDQGQGGSASQQGGGEDGSNGSGQGDGDQQQGQAPQTAAEKAKAYAKAAGHIDDMSVQGKSTPEDSQEDSEWQQRLNRAMTAGRNAGTGIGTLGHKIADIPQSRTPWELLLRRAINKAVTRSPRPSYTAPARRWIGAEDDARRRGRPTPAFEPGFVKQNSHPRIAVCVDVSGSIGDAELNIFSGEIASIGKKTGAELHVIVFDTAVLSVQKLDGVDFEAEIKKIEFARGGGTSFVEMMERAKDIDPSIVVVLTDLYGPFGNEPHKIPVIWASPEENPPEPPFGRLISLTS